MPPKNKKAAKKGKQPEIPLDEIDTTILTREKLEEFCIHVYEDLIKEKQNAEFLTLERDKLASMIPIAVEELVLIKQSNRRKDFDIEEAAEKQRQDLARAREQLINLQSEKNVEKLEVKLETMNMITHRKDCDEQIKKEFSLDIKYYKDKLTELNTNFDMFKNSVAVEHAKQKHNLRRTNEYMQKLVEVKREKIMNNTVSELNKKQGDEYKGLQKRKDNEISEVKRRNSRLTSDLKHYFNKVVNHNLSVITEMKNSKLDMKETAATLESRVQQLRKENRQLATDLEDTTKQENILTNKLISSQRHKNELQMVKNKLQNNTKLKDNLMCELDVLTMIKEKKGVEFEERTRKSDISCIKSTTRDEEVNLMLEYIVTQLHLQNIEADAILATLEGKRIKDTALDEVNYNLLSTERRRQRALQRYKKLLKLNHVHMDDTGFQVMELRDLLASAAPTEVWVVLQDLEDKLSLYC